MKKGRMQQEDVDRSLQVYLQDIGKIPLISQEREVELTKKIKKGDEKALRELVEANLRFVVSVAKEYQHQGIPLKDLINEGNLGLIKAARRFDETRGFKFISYAVWWVRQAILVALAEQSRIVRLPLNRVGTLYKVGKTSDALGQKFGRVPSHKEIADELNLPQQGVSETMRIHPWYLSLDQPVSDDKEDYLFIDTLEGELQPQPDEFLRDASLKRAIELAVNSLKEREAEVLLLYFGLNDEAPLTLEEIGHRFNLTRERIRQIKEGALGRLRKAAHGKALIRYLV